MKILIVFLSMMFMSIVSYANSVEYYHVRKDVAEMTGVGNSNVLVESDKGVYWGFPRSLPDAVMPANRHSMTMQFEFFTENYFSKGNTGHIAIGIRGDSYNGLLGRGIIIGNVTGLPGDNATSQPAAIALESFWATGNAVYGKATESVVMENGVQYRITISSKGQIAEVIGYVLEKKTGEYWTEVASREIVDYKGIGKASHTLGGWFIAEVFSTHSWSYKIDNVKVWYD